MLDTPALTLPHPRWTERRFVVVKSVKGSGIKTMSRCLGVIPCLVILRIVPEVKTAFKRLHQVGRFCLLLAHKQDDLNRRALLKLQKWQVNLAPRVQFCHVSNGLHPTFPRHKASLLVKS